MATIAVIRPKFTLDGDEKLQAALKRLYGKQVDKALATAFRRTATPIPGYMARAMKGYYTPKQRELKNAIRKPRIVMGSDGPEIHIKSGAMPLSGRLFKPLKGVRHVDRSNASIKVFKGGKRQPRQRAFRNPSAAKPRTMTMGGPFVRDTDKRLPISKVMGPSFWASFTGGRYKDAVLNDVAKKVEVKLESAAKDALKAAARGFIK
jgi:hypothetical protein